MEKYKVLIVEDAKVYRSIYEGILRRDRFDLRILPEGNGFIRTAEEFVPDVILMDVNLPDANGIDLCRLADKNPKLNAIPIIIVSVENDIEVLKRAYQSGVTDYIRKPFNEIELLIRIENVLKLSFRQKELIRLYQNQAITEMGRAIAHTFNQPLTTILGSAEILLMQKQKVSLNEDVVELLEIIANSSRKLASLVEKVEKTHEYKTQVYLDNIKIVDLGNEESENEKRRFE